LSIAKVVDTSLKVALSPGTKSWGLRPYKMVHPSDSTFAETLFFAAPSTSGLVTQFQRPDKARIFGELRQLVEDMKAGTLSTTGMMVIQPHQIAKTPPKPEPAGLDSLLSFALPTQTAGELYAFPIKAEGSSSDLFSSSFAV